MDTGIVAYGLLGVAYAAMVIPLWRQGWTARPRGRPLTLLHPEAKPPAVLRAPRGRRSA